MSYEQRLYQWQSDCTRKIYEYVESVREKQVAAIAAIAVCTKSVATKRSYKKKRYWMANILNKRRQIGFYHLVCPLLKLDNSRFYNYFRMTVTQFEKLLQIIAPRITRQHVVREPIGAEQRLIICLRYLASGDSMVSLAHQYSVSKTIVTQIIYETCQAIWEELQPKVLSPCTAREWKSIAHEMNEKWQFPHCIGAMDGKHVVIQSPSNSGSAYYNYKKSHSIVLLAICDANHCFTYVDIGAYGRQSDGGIFKNASIGKKFAQGLMDVPPCDEIYEGSLNYPYVLVADEAFPLTPYLMRPFPGRDGLSPEKKIFNYRLSRARRVIENAFGILAAQWRIYRKPIIANVETVEKMIQATVTLHNWLRKDSVNTNSFTANMPDRELSDGSIIEGTWRRIIDLNTSALQQITPSSMNTSSRTSAVIRQQFMEYFNEEGAVPWQFLRIYQ